MQTSHVDKGHCGQWKVKMKHPRVKCPECGRMFSVSACGIRPHTNNNGERCRGSGQIPKRRRVVIEIEVFGTDKQADSVRDAIGLAAHDEWLSGIVTPLVHSEKIQAVNWSIRGELWVPTQG